MSAELNTLNTLKNHGIASEMVPLSSGDVLHVQAIVRVVPNRRLVCKAVWRNQAVFAKLFLGAEAARYAARDEQGVRLLEHAAIDTPPILARDTIAGLDSPLLVKHAQANQVLIFKAMEPSLNAEALYLQANLPQRQQLVTRLVQTLATHHQAGIVQTDLYFKNFLVVEDRIYSIDGDGIRQSTPLSTQQALQQLCRLLSKVDVLELHAHAAVWLQQYADVRGWSVLPSLDKVIDLISQARKRALTKYADNKVFRACTDVRVEQHPTQFSAYSNAFFEVAQPLSIATLDALLNSNNTLKSGNTCTVGVANLQGQPVVIKRYNIKGFWHGVGRALRKSRAAISWANAHRLQLLGIATPASVALIEQRRWGAMGFYLTGKTYFLSAYVEAPDAAEFFAQTEDKALRAEAVKQLVQLMYRLYLLDISHGDLKATNIKMPNASPMLIDLDGMQQHRQRAAAQKAHARDLRRLMQNWKQDASLYNAFIKVFKVVYADHAPLLAAKILE